MMVKELLALLEREHPEAVVQFAYKVGDKFFSGSITQVAEGLVTYNFDYMRDMVVHEDDMDLNDKKQRAVVLVW